MESLFIPSAPSFDDRAELFHAELYREIKRKLYSGRKDDPATRIEIRIDQDVFDGGLASTGKSRKERGKTVYRINSNQAWESNGMNVYSMKMVISRLLLKELRHFRRWVPQQASSTGNV